MLTPLDYIWSTIRLELSVANNAAEGIVGIQGQNLRYVDEMPFLLYTLMSTETMLLPRTGRFAAHAEESSSNPIVPSEMFAYRLTTLQRIVHEHLC